MTEEVKMDFIDESELERVGEGRQRLASEVPMAIDRSADKKIDTNVKKAHTISAKETNQSVASKIDNATNSQAEADDKKKANQRKRGRKKKNKQKPVDCPDKIVEYVLANSNFKVPNLSQKLDDLIKSQDPSRVVQYEYKDTVPDLSEKITVMPVGFEHVNVEVDPEAITQLQCIYHQPQHPMRRRRNKKQKGGRKRRGAQA